MAGKFMSIEEAARLLGVSSDEINRLVDRKKLFPMRDGATMKFKADEVERLVRSLGEEASSASSGLDLELDTPGIALHEPGRDGGGDDDQLILDDGDIAVDSIFGSATPAGPSPSDTGVGKGSVAAQSNSGLSLSSPGGLSGADLLFGDSVLGDDAGSEDLSLESIIGASSPSIGKSGASPSGISGSGGLSIDLSGISGSGSAQSGKALGSGIGGLSGPGLSGPGLSIAGGSGIGGLSGPGLGGLSGPGLSGGLGSGVSLEGSGLADSGVDLGSASAAKSGISGDDFELGGETTDDESASVVIASDSEAGDSSFFGQTLGGQSSTFGDDSSLGSAGSSEALAFPTIALDEMSFSVWQIVGLVCCSLLLLFGGFIAYDLVRTIGSPESTTLSNPLLNSLAEAFGWR
ncbi:MAG: DNA-binding protein [Planctomycetota bacterium]|nr:MAG: DNA-binding protein [Planctomycetota bacterium]